ncbi:MAG: hypothetical protein CVU48_07140 [Candidatus Cloacimonetes bacterium HGW-Cloacimonetes-1]|jgi:SAM-dependent methyltransferase|nr:MAG: hypothetical protein CVU48_07140 [Candidatus Cloacimonetes bacterium HGW-Cloacimonetes-1]
MAIPIINNWKKYYSNAHEGRGSSYERVVINNTLKKMVEQFKIKSVLETPSFGFTGMSGINLMDLAKSGLQITLEDNDRERIENIRHIWEDIKLPVNISYNPDFATMQYPDNSFDMVWNFSAIWFVQDLNAYLSEISRVAAKMIVICVPNQFGLGYRLQKHNMTSSEEKGIQIRNIDPDQFVSRLYTLNWKLVQTSLIDCPPWPDIGMNIEDFLAKHCMLCKLYLYLKNKLNLPGSGSCKIPQPATKIISILDYYNGNDPDFVRRMMRYSWLERYLPEFIAKYWAHHRYFIFVPR